MLLRPRESRTRTFPGMLGLAPARGRTRRWPFPCASGFGITQCVGFNRSQQDAPLLFSEALEPAQLFYKRWWLRLTLDRRLLCMVIPEKELAVRVSQSGGVLASKSRGGWFKPVLWSISCILKMFKPLVTFLYPAHALMERQSDRARPTLPSSPPCLAYHMRTEIKVR
uniref:uncharacterized protein LOC114670871 n=1 Tax=Macaca mulatta TaxID=9544 RepID=UPI0010A27D6D|nr:uncharacterized protein LOC114670871 [Macaca mulatta]